MPPEDTAVRQPKRVWTRRVIVFTLCLPVLGWLLNEGFQLFTGYLKSQADIHQRLNTLEGDKANNEAIWQAITKNRENQVNSRSTLVEKFNAMAVKYEAAMLVFEMNHKRGFGGSAPLVVGPSEEDMLKMFDEMLQEVQKAEETDKAEIDRLKKEVGRMRKESADRKKAAVQQEELIENLKMPPQVQQPAIQRIDPKILREKYERDFPNKKAPIKK